jgi:hypothetical protein
MAHQRLKLFGIVITSVVGGAFLDRVCTLYIRYPRQQPPRIVDKPPDDGGGFADELTSLSSKYLTADSAGEARAKLVDIVALAEQSNLPPSGKADLLYLTYARLYVMDRRLNDDLSAKADFVKVQYWYLRSFETGNRPEVVAARLVLDMTPRKCEDWVDKFDKARTDGRGPAYTLHIEPMNRIGTTRTAQ